MQAPHVQEGDIRLEGLHVLLAEDNDLNAEIAEELLALKKIIVDRASDGREAVSMFAESPEGLYDVILMDVNMPVLDGLAATREIRSMNRRDCLLYTSPGDGCHQEVGASPGADHSDCRHDCECIS